MTDHTLDLDGIRARLADVPPGPWSHGEDEMIGGLKAHRIGNSELNHDVASVPVGEGTLAVAEFIVHAREDVPALMSALARSENRVFELQFALESVKDGLTRMIERGNR